MERSEEAKPAETESEHSPRSLMFLMNGFGAIGAVLIFEFLAWEIISLIIGYADVVRPAATLRVEQVTGQVLMVLLPALVMARVQSRNLALFLRLRPSPVLICVAAILGAAGLSVAGDAWAIVQELYLLPDGMRAEYVAELNEMRNYYEPLTSWESVPELMVVFLVVGVLPAICEEIWFRGLVQRNFERALSPVPAIVLAGFGFAAVHFQYSTLVEFTLLGAFSGYLVWRSGSIIPAMLSHFAYNVISILSPYDERGPDGSFIPATPEQLMMYLPWSIAGLVLVLLTLLWVRTMRTPVPIISES